MSQIDQKVNQILTEIFDEKMTTLDASNDETKNQIAAGGSLHRKVPVDSFISLSLQLAEYWSQKKPKYLVLASELESIEIILQNDANVEPELPEYTYTLF